MPESRCNPNNKDLARKISEMEEVINATRDVLINIMISLLAPKQVLLSQEAILIFLKNDDVIKSHLSAKATDNTRDKDEADKETNTLINR